MAMDQPLPQRATTCPTSPDATVLVVDDEPALCRTLRMILELEGYRVATATSGPAALERVRTEPPALVLLDLAMPGMDGWQAHARLQRLAPDLPIVFLSAHHRVRQEAASHHAAGALPKPFDVDGVLDLVARFIPSPASCVLSPGHRPHHLEECHADQ